MWGGAGWWGGGSGVLCALALLLLLARRRKGSRQRQRQVLVTRVSSSPRRPRTRSFLAAITEPARATVALLTAPADDRPVPHIIVVHNPTPIPTQPSTSRNDDKNREKEKPLPKLPLPEQWIHKRPSDYLNRDKFVIPRPLAQVNSNLGADLTQESRAKKFSATRSPSLEKDDKSPFVSSAKSVDTEVFGFDPESVRKIQQDIMMSPRDSDESPSNLKRYRSISTRLNMCSVNESPHETTQEHSEMQNSPRVPESASADKASAPKFDFSPRLLADHMTSPRFFTPPETVSPMFFAEPSPKSVYYDTVRSPKFFPETPREDLSQSPKALGDNINRNGVEKPSSPRILSARASPKVYSYNKENYFTFETVVGESAPRMSPSPKKYGGRNSIERERFTPPVDREAMKYRRHNSCDTNYKNVEINIASKGDKEPKEIIKSEDVVDCCAKMDSLHIENEKAELLPPNSAQARRQRLKSISLDSDNAKIIEQNLGLPIAKQMKDQMNEAYKNQDTSNSIDSMERFPKTPEEKPIFKFDNTIIEKDIKDEEPCTPDLRKKGLRQSSDTQSFIDMPRFSPKEFEITVTTEEGATCTAETQTKKKSRPNLTIDLSKRDEALEKELLEFEKLYTDAEEKKVRTPTLKVKSTSLDSSETVNLSLPQKKSLDVPQNSVSVPNTPKRQLKRILAQKSKDFAGAKLGYTHIQVNPERRLYIKAQDSGIFLRENHASLMLYQPGPSRISSRTMGSFDENIADPPEINILAVDNRCEPHILGSNLGNYKQNLSVSSTNLKTLPEGVPSDDFEPSAEDEKLAKKLHRRNSNQSLLLSTHSLQSSNCSLTSGASCHNLSAVRTSSSNFSINSDGRQKKLSIDRSFERRDSSATNPEHLTPTTRVICTSNASISGESKNCLLQRRGSNNSLTLNIYSSNNLSRHSSNTSLNKEAKPIQKKGLLERRSSNTSLTLNINNSNPQLAVANRGLSISNYNLNGSTCNLSRYNSNYSIDNPTVEQRKGILERRSSNTSLTLNIQPQEPRDLEIDVNLIEPNLKDLPHRDTHRKSLSTENLIPKSYKNRTRKNDKGMSFGSHDNLWSHSYTEQEYPQNLTYVYGDQENEIVYAFGPREEDAVAQQGFVRNITTKPLSPQSTSEDFRLYLANMQHLQNASSVLTRKQLRDLNDVFQNGYSKVKCHSSNEGQHCCSGRVNERDLTKANPQISFPESSVSQPCSEYQKMLLRNLHQEFWDMPTNFQEKPIVSGSHPKNRYKSILPNEHSRFILKPDAGSTSEGYINANFIKGHEYTRNSYIATQGPLQNTIYDFWLMVHQNSIVYHRTHPSKPARATKPTSKVVMLTNFIENNRQKCEKYFPIELNEEITFHSPEYTESASFFSDTELLKNSFTITNIGMVKKSGYTIRKLDIRYRKKLKMDIAKGSDSCDNTSRDRFGKSQESWSSDLESGKSDQGSSKSDHCFSKSDQDSSKSDQGSNKSEPVFEFGVTGYGKSDVASGISDSGSSDKADKGELSENSEVKDSSSSSGSDYSEITVYHYWFHNWADHKCPKDVSALLNLSLDVLKDVTYDFSNTPAEIDEVCKCDSPKPDSKFVFPPLSAEGSKVDVNLPVSPLNFNVDRFPPTIIHCSAGIGRTGCLIAILNGIKQLAVEHKVDILGIVCNMRLNRGGMVQNSEQYELIHKVLCLFEQACLGL